MPPDSSTVPSVEIAFPRDSRTLWNTCCKSDWTAQSRGGSRGGTLSKLSTANLCDAATSSGLDSFACFLRLSASDGGPVIHPCLAVCPGRIPFVAPAHTPSAVPPSWLLGRASKTGRRTELFWSHPTTTLPAVCLGRPTWPPQGRPGRLTAPVEPSYARERERKVGGNQQEPSLGRLDARPHPGR